MSAPAAVGVHNDLSASKSGITLGTTNDKESRWLYLHAGEIT